MVGIVKVRLINDACLIYMVRQSSFAYSVAVLADSVIFNSAALRKCLNIV